MGLQGGPSAQTQGERGLGGLMVELQRKFGVGDFVETGTFEGATAAWAASRFAKVATIEASPELYRAAAARHATLDNVRFVEGDTRVALRDVVGNLEGAALFWLDAHFSGDLTYGDEAECPLLEEIEIVRGTQYAAYLFIDDARLFLSPPPRPHRCEQWPSLGEVVRALSHGERPLESFVYWDALIAVPAGARDFVAGYLQDAATEEWHRRAAAGEAEEVAGSAWGTLGRRVKRALAGAVRRTQKS